MNAPNTSDRKALGLSVAAKPARGSPTVELPTASRLSGVILVVALLLVWEASARLGWVDSRNWPLVTAVFAAIVRGFAGGELAQLLLSTLRRMSIGYVLGGGIGIALGILAGSIRTLRYAIKPLIEVLRPIPAPAIVPPLILLLGVDDSLKITVVAMACFFPVFINTLAGVEGIDDVLLQTARTFRIGRGRALIQVFLPATLPMIAAGLRIAIGIGLVVTVISEMIAGSSGLGYYIVQMQYAMKPEAMYAAIATLAVTGYLLNRVFLALELHFVPWMGKD
jgi:ABC-type nitrate/sulfonate/bicarbonate transport system permease component